MAFDEGGEAADGFVEGEFAVAVLIADVEPVGVA